jgi:hypothetical protein
MLTAFQLAIIWSERAGPPIDSAIGLGCVIGVVLRISDRVAPLAEQFVWTILALLRMLTHQGQIRTTNDQSSSVTSKEYLVTHKSQLVSAGDRASGVYAPRPR